MRFLYSFFSLFVLVGWFSTAFAETEEAVFPSCSESHALSIWITPFQPVLKAPLGIKAVLLDGPADSLVLSTPKGEMFPLDIRLRGGPPWSLTAEWYPEERGTYQIEVWRGGQPVACRTFSVGISNVHGEQIEEWNTAIEAFYATWIEQLFDAPTDENLSFSSLEPVLRDPLRNFLYNYFGRNEDIRLSATPDCADLPYFLRAYFAWKVGLPISFRACDRGGTARAPQCGNPMVDNRFLAGTQSTEAFNSLMRRVADTVHSGSARTDLKADATDFYPIPLERESLWPGTVYADPYGHTLMLSKWIPQTALGKPGLLFAVDAQPDNSVARKRFWEGNFLFARVTNAGPGWKAFRPLRRDGKGKWYLPSNEELATRAPVASYTSEQALLSPEDFYAQMGKLVNPQGLAPEQAYEAYLDALVEQLETRANAVTHGEHYGKTHPNIPMPSGAAIFETTGAWEDYSTPSRDLRLLIAIKAIMRLPEQVVRYPELFSLQGRSPSEAKNDLEHLHVQRIYERRFRYERSDGTTWELSVSEAFARQGAFEMGYNPNDCAEIRWGALPGTSEYAPCTRHATSEQRHRMEQYRTWFHDLRRPIR